MKIIKNSNLNLDNYSKEDLLNLLINNPINIEEDDEEEEREEQINLNLNLIQKFLKNQKMKKKILIFIKL